MTLNFNWLCNFFDQPRASAQFKMHKRQKLDPTAMWSSVISFAAQRGLACFTSLLQVCKGFQAFGQPLRHQHMQAMLDRIAPLPRVPDWWPLDKPLLRGWCEYEYDGKPLRVPALPKRNDRVIRLTGNILRSFFYRGEGLTVLQLPELPEDLIEITEFIKRHSEFLTYYCQISGGGCIDPGEEAFEWKNLVIWPFAFDQQDCVTYLLASHGKEHIILMTIGSVRTWKDWLQHPYSFILVESSVLSFFDRCYARQARYESDPCVLDLHDYYRDQMLIERLEQAFKPWH